MIFQLFGGPQALKLGLVDHAAASMKVEYGDLRSIFTTHTETWISNNTGQDDC